MNIEQLNQWNETLFNLPGFGLTAIACGCVGMFFKWTPVMANRYVPAPVILSGPVFNWLLTEGLSGKAAVSRAVIMGLIAGSAAWAFHAQVVKRFLGEDEPPTQDTKPSEKKNE